ERRLAALEVAQHEETAYSRVQGGRELVEQGGPRGQGRHHRERAALAGQGSRPCCGPARRRGGRRGLGRQAVVRDAGQRRPLRPRRAARRSTSARNAASRSSSAVSRRNSGSTFFAWARRSASAPATVARTLSIITSIPFSIAALSPT